MEFELTNMVTLALRGLTIFPNMMLSFDVERPISIRALERAMETDQQIFLVTQKEINVESPAEKDLYAIGTVSHIRQILRISEKTVRVMMEGKSRARIKRLWQTEPYLQANIELLPEQKTERVTPKVEAMLRQTYSIFGEYSSLLPNMSEEIIAKVMDSRDPGHLADFIAQNIMLRHQDRQIILDELRPMVRLRKINEILTREIDVIAMEQEVAENIRQRVTQVQKEHILQEQIRALQTELGDGEENNEFDEYRRKIKALKLDEDTEKKLLKDVDRLSRQPFGSQEGALLRNYLDVCTEMPWNVRTKERISVASARKILDRDHFGLEKVKERILEFIAVKQMNPDAKGQIICLVGPPGVGKTSIAISVADATNRKLARLSLGGVRDEADIRGHRKTYIGAMPGRVIEAISRSGAMNPLLLLDEIDKLSNDGRGDPASALLEVLDSEQNNKFRDHFLEIPVDLSQVMFITTANSTASIPRPLLDRMELIELGSYTDEEKLEIAKRHLLPKQMKEHGVSKNSLRISDDTLRRVISDYTRESGVRRLERQLAKICRKAAMRIVDNGVKRVTITESNLADFLGIPRYRDELVTGKDEVGIVNGLAWTEVGGEILQVEVSVMEGDGKLKLTGNLGEVMKESAQAAMTCLRTRSAALGLDKDFYKNTDIHVHFPEAAVPKDGPSAGIAMTTAILSALSGRKAIGTVAMTGEVTLRGRVLPLGGLKEKTMAALRNGMKTVIIPQGNVKDLEDIDPVVRNALQFIPVETVDAVFAAALRYPEKMESASARTDFSVLSEVSAEHSDAALRQ